MTVFNVSVEDTSPLITYNGGWITHFEGEANPDLYIQNYTGQTFHETNVTGSNATFTFNGSAIYVYGSRRPHHGWYTVYLDDQIMNNSANSQNPEFGAALYAASGLDSARHTLTIINQGDPDIKDRKWVDIDNIVFTTGDSSANTTYEWSSTNSSSKSFQWSGNWTSQANRELDLDDTQHYSWTPGASVNISFEGPLIQLYGFTHPRAGQYSVSIDGSSAQHFNATSPTPISNSTLFFASGLSQGQHNLVLTNTGPDMTFVSVGSIRAAQVKPSFVALEVAGITMLVFGLLSAAALVSIIIRRRRRAKQEAVAGLRPYRLLKEPSTSHFRPRGPSREPTEVVPWPEPRPSASQEQVHMIRSAMVSDVERGHSDVATYGSSRRHDRDASSAPLLEGHDVYRSPSQISLDLDPPDYTSPKPSMRAVIPQRQKASYRR